MKNGCSFGKENRIMILDIKEDLKEIKELIKSKNGIPTGTIVLISSLCAIMGVLAGIIF